MNARNDTWNSENWQQLGDVALRLVKEAARKRCNASGPERNPEIGENGMPSIKDSALKGGAQ